MGVQHQGFESLVPAVDGDLDGGDEVLDGGEVAAADGLAGDELPAFPAGKLARQFITAAVRPIRGVLSSVQTLRVGQQRIDLARELAFGPHHPLVRVVQCHLLATDGALTETFALLSTLLDVDTAPAAELAELHHARWQIDNTFGSFKSQLKGDGVVLRSKTPTGSSGNCGPCCASTTPSAN